MKGDTNWIVWLLVAVVAAGIILYLMWSKGIGPFSQSVNEAQCKAKAIQICNTCITGGTCDFSGLSSGCRKILKANVGGTPVTLDSALSGTVSKEDWCTAFLEKT